MDFARLIFAATQTFNKSIFMVVGCPLILLVCSFAIGADLSIIGTFLITIAAAFTIVHVLYWLKFYYMMYNVSDIFLDGNWTDPKDPHRLLLYRHVQVGHREAFARKATAHSAFKQIYSNNPNAILYGDIVVVGGENASHAEIEDTLREHRNKRGTRWNNNFPVGKGMKGFVNTNGNFHSFDPQSFSLAQRT